MKEDTAIEITAPIPEKLFFGIFATAGLTLLALALLHLTNGRAIEATALCGSGLMFCSAASFLLSLLLSRPSRFVLGEEGIRVESKGSKAELPGSILRDMEIRKVRRRYAVSVFKNDNGHTDLHLFFLHSRAASFLEKYFTAFDRNAKGKAPSPSDLSSRARFIEENGSIRFEWKDLYTPRFLFSLFLMLSGIVFMTGGSFLRDSESSLFYLPLAVAALWILFGVLRSRSKNRYAAIRIVEKKMEYGSVESGSFHLVNDPGPEKIKRIIFNYDISTAVQYWNVEREDGSWIRIPLAGLSVADAQIALRLLSKKLSLVNDMN